MAMLMAACRCVVAGVEDFENEDEHEVQAQLQYAFKIFTRIFSETTDHDALILKSVA
jgi:hypothetical protein